MRTVDKTKTPVEVTGNCMELDYDLPWRMTSVCTKEQPLKHYAWMADCNGNTVSMDTDCVKFVINCVNRHSKCLDAMFRILSLCLLEDCSQEPFKTIYRIALAYCHEQLVEDGAIDKEKVGSAEKYEDGEKEREDMENEVRSHIGSLSDGFHTYDELYAHRTMLFALLTNSKEYRDLAWKSRLHSDGTKSYDGFFIAGMTLPNTGKQITYHVEDELWDCFRCKELERAPEWDGHTSIDVEERLYEEIDSQCEGSKDGESANV